MTTFIDPRSNPEPVPGTLPARTTPEPKALKKLHQLCRKGRLYDIERWVQEGRPLQLAENTDPPRGRWSTALEIALERGDHALTLLLLCNGYDPNLEPYSPLDAALQDRRKDLLGLLLAWGADPHEVDLHDLFDTYDSKLFARFRDLGVDLTARHGMARALGYHSSNKPLYGFARRLRKSDPKIQAELNAALAHHADEGNERGVALCLWAGADPHAPTCNLRWGCDCEEGEPPWGSSAIRRACSSGHLEILELFGLDPERDDFDELYEAADSGAVVQYLAQYTLPTNPASLIRHHLFWVTVSFGRDHYWSRWRATSVLERLFKLGMRCHESPPSQGTKNEIANIRRCLLKASDDAVVDIMKLLAKDDHCSPEILHELARTPAIRRRMREVGFMPFPGEESSKYRRRRPTRAAEMRKKFDVEPPKSGKSGKVERSLHRIEYIGSRRGKDRELHLDRPALYKHVWSEPVSTLAKKWGISDRGLAKASRRLKIPTPGRGYWAKVKAGKKPRRPRLPKVPEGQAEEIVVWVRG